MATGAAAVALRDPALLQASLLPLCDAPSALRLLAASKPLRREAKHFRSLDVVRQRGSESLDPPAARGLARLIAAAAGLRRLRLALAYQELGMESAGEIADAVGKCHALQDVLVDLRRSRLGDAGVARWASSVGALPAMRVLDLRLGFTGAGAEAARFLAAALRKTTALNHLRVELDINRIGDQAALELLAAALAEPSRLERVHIDLAQSGMSRAGAARMGELLDDRLRALASAGAAQLAPAGLCELALDLRGNGLKSDGRARFSKVVALAESLGCRCTIRT